MITVPSSFRVVLSEVGTFKESVLSTLHTVSDTLNSITDAQSSLRARDVLDGVFGASDAVVRRLPAALRLGADAWFRGASGSGGGRERVYGTNKIEL